MCYSPMVNKALKDLSRDFGVEVDSNAFDAYSRLSRIDPRQFPDMANEQIFPGHYAPVITSDSLQPMRFSAWPPSNAINRLAEKRINYTTYNARLENLGSPFWLSCPGLSTGVVKIKSFLEWVNVRDLIADGKISLAVIEKRFEEKLEARKKDVLRSGKKFSMTATEKKAPIDRKVTIRIKPQTDDGEIYTPVLISRNIMSDLTDPDGMPTTGLTGGFAIITAPAPDEIRCAGHDRCPVHVSRDVAFNWLSDKSCDPRLISQNMPTTFTYQLD